MEIEECFQLVMRSPKLLICHGQFCRNKTCFQIIIQICYSLIDKYVLVLILTNLKFAD